MSKVSNSATSSTHTEPTLDRLDHDQFKIMRDRLSDIGDAVSETMILAMRENAGHSYTSLACIYEQLNKLAGDLNPVPPPPY